MVRLGFLSFPFNGLYTLLENFLFPGCPKSRLDSAPALIGVRLLRRLGWVIYGTRRLALSHHLLPMLGPPLFLGRADTIMASGDKLWVSFLCTSPRFHLGLALSSLLGGSSQSRSSLLRHIASFAEVGLSQSRLVFRRKRGALAGLVKTRNCLPQFRAFGVGSTKAVGSLSHFLRRQSKNTFAANGEVGQWPMGLAPDLRNQLDLKSLCLRQRESFCQLSLGNHDAALDHVLDDVGLVTSALIAPAEFMMHPSVTNAHPDIERRNPVLAVERIDVVLAWFYGLVRHLGDFPARLLRGSVAVSAAPSLANLAPVMA